MSPGYSGLLTADRLGAVRERCAASGRGRSQIMDSNWIVVAQEPLPGTPIREGEANLFVLKLDEPHGC